MLNDFKGESERLVNDIMSSDETTRSDLFRGQEFKGMPPKIYFQTVRIGRLTDDQINFVDLETASRKTQSIRNKQYQYLHFQILNPDITLSELVSYLGKFI